MFEGAFSDSIIKRAVEKNLVSIRLVNFRDFAGNKHNIVDDYPFGGDPGMLIKPEPLVRALTESKERLQPFAPEVIFMSPHGEPLTHRIAEELSRKQSLIVLCGRYKGIDQRVIDHHIDREISIGDYVLSGGEIPAMALIDAVTRLIPGVLGNAESAGCDSFFDGLLSPPNYTRPEIFEGEQVPEILLSGHHKNIRLWQLEQAIAMTQKKRPDLWQKYCKNHPELTSGTHKHTSR
jgi:tRNA (guanine37-N1)-methyltransferase